MSSPKNALVIGLGSGVTAAAALTHEPASVTAVEISPDVVDAAREFFGDANQRVLENPKLRLVVGDARQHVLAEPDRYDVIISEPSNPWMAGVSALFTREFFTAVRSRLVEGGVFCQWGHLYNMSEADLATLLATFGDVFPKASVYVISEADILIVGRDGSSALSSARLEGMSAGRPPRSCRLEPDRGFSVFDPHRGPRRNSRTGFAAPDGTPTTPRFSISALPFRSTRRPPPRTAGDSFLKMRPGLSPPSRPASLFLALRAVRSGRMKSRSVRSPVGPLRPRDRARVREGRGAAPPS